MNTLIETTYDNYRFLIPYNEMSEWLAHIRDLSFFSYDCGHLQIAFFDKFKKYIKQKPFMTDFKSLTEIKKLKAIELVKNNPELLALMAEFKRQDFVGSYIQQTQSETEEDLASAWLFDLKNHILKTV